MSLFNNNGHGRLYNGYFFATVLMKGYNAIIEEDNRFIDSKTHVKKYIYISQGRNASFKLTFKY